MTDDRPIVYRRAKLAYLTPEAFAAHWGVSKMTVYRLVHTGGITANRIGRSFRIPLAELERFTAATLVDPDVESATTQGKSA